MHGGAGGVLKLLSVWVCDTVNFLRRSLWFWRAVEVEVLLWLYHFTLSGRLLLAFAA